MRRASEKRSVSLRAIPATLPRRVRTTIAISDAPIGDGLSQASEATARICPIQRGDADQLDAHHRTLEVAIRERIEARLPGRVRNLIVRSFDSLAILEGQCATYYTKQLAQHAAMGILEDQHLENAIVVSVPQ